MRTQTSLARLNDARERYMWAKYVLGSINKYGGTNKMIGLWLSKCAVAKQRLRYCCNALHSELSWADADATRLTA